MDTQGRFFAILAVGIFQVESWRNSEIDLVGGYCEFPADSAPDLDIDFGSLKGRFIGNLDVVDS